MPQFNPNLHDFLLKVEMSMEVDRGKLLFGAHVPFEDMQDFTKLLGCVALDDGGLLCTLNNENTLFVPLEDYFINNDYLVKDYRACFNATDMIDNAYSIKRFDAVYEYGEG